MTPEREAFIEYSLLGKEQPVVAANGSTLRGIARGRVRISVRVNGHVKSIILTDVLHVPQIKGNLISVARLQDKGLVVEITSLPEKPAMVIKHQGRKVGVASRVGKSYVLDMPIESAMPAELVADHQEEVTNRREAVADLEEVTDRQEAGTDLKEGRTDRKTAVYTRWH